MTVSKRALGHVHRTRERLAGLGEIAFEEELFAERGKEPGSLGMLGLGCFTNPDGPLEILARARIIAFPLPRHSSNLERARQGHAGQWNSSFQGKRTIAGSQRLIELLGPDNASAR